MNRFSLTDRVIAMERAVAALAPNLPMCHPCYPSYPVDIRNGGTSFPLMHIPPAPIDHPTAVSPIPNTKNFPETLFNIISAEDYSDIISWLPHGQGFIIHDKDCFAKVILSRYFDGAKFTSFTRRLKRWKFFRVPRGRELGAYYNSNFKRDQPELVQKMMYRMEDEKDKDVDEGEENLEEQIEVKIEKKDQENPPMKAHDRLMPSPSTSPNRLTKNKSYPSCATNRVKSSVRWANLKEHIEKEDDIRPNPKGAAKSDSPSVKRLSDSITSLAEADGHLMPLPSISPKRPNKKFKMSTATHTTNHGSASGFSGGTHHPTLSTNAAESSSLLLGHPRSSAIDDLYERMIEVKAQREILARSMATARFMDGCSMTSLSGHSAPQSMNSIERMECIHRILEAERVLEIKRYFSDYLPSSSAASSLSDIAASSRLPSFIQGYEGMRSNVLRRVTLPFEGSIGMSVCGGGLCEECMITQGDKGECARYSF